MFVLLDKTKLIFMKFLMPKDFFLREKNRERFRLYPLFLHFITKYSFKKAVGGVHGCI